MEKIICAKCNEEIIPFPDDMKQQDDGTFVHYVCTLNDEELKKFFKGIKFVEIKE